MRSGAEFDERARRPSEVGSLPRYGRFETEPAGQGTGNATSRAPPAEPSEAIRVVRPGGLEPPLTDPEHCDADIYRDLTSTRAMQLMLVRHSIPGERTARTDVTHPSDSQGAPADD